VEQQIRGDGRRQRGRRHQGDGEDATVAEKGKPQRSKERAGRVEHEARLTRVEAESLEAMV
jgi:hypothetical protein